MLSSTVLDRCIGLLSWVSASAHHTDEVKEALLEVGYILRQEYDVACQMEKDGEIATKNSDFTIKGLVADNTQLFKEKEDLLNDNIKLKKIIESTMPSITKKIQLLLEQLASIN